MNTLVLPAPLWRRLVAALYDGLLLLALWMIAALADVLIRDQLLGLSRDWGALQAFYFLVGFFFFGWFWTHGGQTLGMRAWRLHLRRQDGAAIRWPIAGLRYAVMMISWGVLLTPLVLLLPIYSDHPNAFEIHLGAILASGIGLLSILTDARKRAPCDRFSATEVVVLPKGVEASDPVA